MDKLTRHFKFQNQTFDKCDLEPNPIKEIRLMAGLTVAEIAVKMGISEKRIINYEKNKNWPIWYYNFLRVIGGDLSIFGTKWQNYRIHGQKQNKLITPYDIELEPIELIPRYNQISREHLRENMKLRQENTELKKRLANRNKSNIIELSRYRN